MIAMLYIIALTVAWPLIKFIFKGAILVGSLFKFGFVKTGIWVWVAQSLNRGEINHVS